MIFLRALINRDINQSLIKPLVEFCKKVKKRYPKYGFISECNNYIVLIKVYNDETAHFKADVIADICKYFNEFMAKATKCNSLFYCGGLNILDPTYYRRDSDIHSINTRDITTKDIEVSNKPFDLTQ